MFSALVLGWIGFAASALCAAAAIAFATVWAPFIEVEGKVVEGGHFLPLTTIVLFIYAAVVFFVCSVVTLNLFRSRRIMAGIFGGHWKLTTVLMGTALLCSVMYFFVSFAASHFEPGDAVGGRPYYRYATFFSYGLIIPQPKFTREDGLTALFLFMSASVSYGMFLFMSLRADHHSRPTLPKELWGTFGVGLMWLAFDEFLDANRFLLANAANLGLLSFREAFAYFILVAYAVIAFSILLSYATELWTDRTGFFSLILGAMFQIAALSVDFLFRAWRKEEAFEIAEAAMFLIAVLYYAYDELDSYIEHRRTLA